MAQLFPALVIFLMLLDMAISVDYRDVVRVRHEYSLVARTVLSVLVLVPLFTLCLLNLDALPLPTKLALALLASAPGAPLSSKRAAALGSRLATAMALQLIVANLGVITAPLTAMGLAWARGLQVHIPIEPLAWQLFTVQVIPLTLGAVLRHWFPQVAARIEKPLSTIANVAMLVLIVLMVAKMGGVLMGLDPFTWGALLAFSAFALTVGHTLGGPDPETRVAVAVASANRNLGMAGLLGSLVGETFGVIAKEAVPLIMAFALVNFGVSTVYQVLQRRKAQDAGVSPAA